MDLTVQIDEPMSMEANAGTGIAYNPVTSVNNKTGAVVLDAEDVGAYELPATGIPESDLSEAVKTKLNKQGAVTDVKKNGTSVVVDGVANIIVPTKTSDITNDSGFLTAHQDISGKADKTQKVNGKALSGDITLDAEDVGALPDDTEIPEKTSDLTNDSGFVTNSVNNLLNYYLKSETYTKAEVQALISAIEKITMEVVSVLPETGEANKIYLVPSASSQVGNVKDEFIWINNAWEQIGSTAIDLSNYYTKSETNTLVNAKYTKPETGVPKTDLASDVQTSLGKADTALQEHQSLSAYRTSADQDVIDATKANASDLTSHTGNTTIHVTSQNKTDWNAKSVVSVASTGTATDEVEYITINGVEKKIKSGDEAVWGNITGTLSNQTDLNTVLSDKVSYQDKVTSWQTTPDNNHYPSEKLVKDTIDSNTAEMTASEVETLWGSV